LSVFLKKFGKMGKTGNDWYQPTAALSFMLFSAFLLLFSFGNDGEASLLTFFYLALILVLGIYLYVISLQRREIKVADRGEVMQQNGEPEGNFSQDEFHSGHTEEENAEDEVFDIELFMDELLKNRNDEEASEALMERFLSAAANKFEAVQGIVYLKDNDGDTFSCAASYAFYSDNSPASFEKGVTLPGQVAKNQEILNIDNIPEGYMTVLSGLGESRPRHLLIAPFVWQGETVAVTEIASFKPFTGEAERFFLKAGRILSKEITLRESNKNEYLTYDYN